MADETPGIYSPDILHLSLVIGLSADRVGQTLGVAPPNDGARSMRGSFRDGSLLMVLPDGRSIIEIDKAGWEDRLAPNKVCPARLERKGGPHDGEVIDCDITLVPDRRNVTATLIPARVYLRLPTTVTFADLVGSEYEVTLSAGAV